MDLLKYYPKIEEATRRYSSVNESYQTLLSICNGAKRRSGRLVADHCVGIANRVAHYVNDPVDINAALLHDIQEDYNLSFEEVKSISGRGRKGAATARIVSILSKPRDIKDKNLRDYAYMRQLVRGIMEMKQKGKGIGVVKLCDRLDNLSDVTYMPPDRIAFILWQSIIFYAPLALKLNLPGLSKRILSAAIQHL